MPRRAPTVKQTSTAALGANYKKHMDRAAEKKTEEETKKKKRNKKLTVGAMLGTFGGGGNYA